MVLHRSVRGVALAAATLMSFSPVLANAEQHHPGRYHHHHYYHSYGGYGAVPYSYYGAVPQGRYACVPWCRTDFNPCDPPYFKMADGRCFDY